MKVKFIAAIALTAALSFTLTGCFPTGPRQTSSQESESADSEIETSAAESAASSKSYVDDLKKTEKFNLDIDVPSEIPKIRFTTMNVPTLDSIKSLSIFDGQKIIEEKETSAIQDLQSTGYVLKTDDFTFRIKSSETWITYNDPIKEAQDFASTKSSSPLLEYSENADFVDFPRSEAINKVVSLANELGITNLGEPRCVAVTADDMNKTIDKYSEKYSDFESVRLSENDGVYYIVIPIAMNGFTTAYADRGSLPAMGDDPGEIGGIGATAVMAVVSSNGIASFQAWGYLGTQTNDFETAENISVKYSASEAFELLAQQEHLRFKNSPDIFTSCSMVYIVDSMINLYKPNQTSVFVPVWEFRFIETNDLGPRDRCFYVHPESGKIMST